LITKIADSPKAAARAMLVQRDGRSWIPTQNICRMAREFVRKMTEWTILMAMMMLRRLRTDVKDGRVRCFRQAEMVTGTHLSFLAVN